MNLKHEAAHVFTFIRVLELKGFLHFLATVRSSD